MGFVFGCLVLVNFRLTERDAAIALGCVGVSGCAMISATCLTRVQTFTHQHMLIDESVMNDSAQNKSRSLL